MNWAYLLAAHWHVAQPLLVWSIAIVGAAAVHYWYAAFVEDKP